MSGFALDPDVSSILDMLVYARPHKTSTEKRFIKRFISPLGVKRDSFGNRYKRIGSAPILWSCHTDTVHRAYGIQHIKTNGRQVWLGKDSASNCLGADDGAGVWLMVEMIKAKVPGLYVFHRAEEWGGRGSTHIATHEPQNLKGIECAVAFDRKGTSSVITHQGLRCASDEFGNSLAKILGLGYKLDDTGVFTDTANYTDHIGECTNISVGYTSEHTKFEQLDMDHLRKLRDRVCRADFSGLTFKRKPGEKDTSWSDKGQWWKNYRDIPKADLDYRPQVDLPLEKHTPDLARLCREHPDVAAAMLEGVGYTAKDFLAELHAGSTHAY